MPEVRPVRVHNIRVDIDLNEDNHRPQLVLRKEMDDVLIIEDDWDNLLALADLIRSTVTRVREELQPTVKE